MITTTYCTSDITRIKRALFIMLIVMIFQSCIAPNLVTDSRGQTYMMDDADKHLYRVAAINGQWWMVDNYNRAVPASKYYLNNEKQYGKLGRMYNWQQAKEMAPKGWRLPTYKELADLFLQYGDVAYSGDLATFRAMFGPYNPDSTLSTLEKLKKDSMLHLPLDTLQGMLPPEPSDENEYRTLIWSKDTANYDAYAIYWRDKIGVFFSEYPKRFNGFVRYIKASPNNSRLHKITRKQRKRLKKE